MIAKLLERLAEMFPGQNYQTRLDYYLQSKQVQTCADIEYWTREYERNSQGTVL
jgi:hypothetical protein